MFAYMSEINYIVADNSKIIETPQFLLFLLNVNGSQARASIE